MSLQDWDKIIEDWFKSGDSPANYCKKHSLGRTSFYTQRQKRKDKYPLKSEYNKPLQSPISFQDITEKVANQTISKTPVLILKSASGLVVEVFG